MEEIMITRYLFHWK